MKQADWIIDAKKIVALVERNKVNPHLHNALNLGALCFLIGIFIFLAILSPSTNPFTFALLAGMVFSFIFYSLFIIVVHEAAHNMFVFARDPKTQVFWNKVFGWAVCIPFFVNFKMNWEKGHIQHHRQPMGPTDTEVCDPIVGKDLFIRCLKFLFIPGYTIFWAALRGKGPNFNCAGEEENFSNNWWVVTAGSVFWGMVIAAIIVSYHVYFNSYLRPIIPGFFAMMVGLNILAVLMLIRQGLEHGDRIEESNRLLRSRTTCSALFYFLIPWGIGYHFEHHLLPTIPWYQLRSAHQAIRKVVPEKQSKEIFNEGARQAFAQLKGNNLLAAVPK